MVPERDMRVEDPDGWLCIDVGSGQDPNLFPWAHVGLASRKAFDCLRRL